MAEFILKPNPGMQTDILESPADEILMGGGAGTGKSYILLTYDLEDALRFARLNVVFIRRHLTDLADLIDKAKRMYEPFGAKFYPMHSTYRKPMFIFPRFDAAGRIVGPDGAKFFFGYLSNYTDTERFQGLEFQRVRFDELAQFAEKEYLYLFSRMRSCFDEATGEAIRTHMMSSCNPIGPGMLWVKRRWVDKLPPGEIKYMGTDHSKGGRDTELPTSHPHGRWRQWLPGDRADNLHLDHASYEANLAQLDSQTYNALALGKWEVQARDRALFDPKWLDHALSGDVEWTKSTNDALGADVAHGGGDRAVILKGDGNRVLYIKFWQGLTDLNVFAVRVQEAAAEWERPCYIAIDSNGIGAGPTDLLQFGGAANVNGSLVTIRPHYWLERCLLKDDVYDQTWKGAKKFNSFKSQAYWKLREDLRLGKIDLSVLNSPDESLNETNDGTGGIYFTDVHLLLEELQSIEYDDDDGVFKITPKRKLRRADSLGRSPDFADALVYWNWVRERTAEAETESEAERYERWVEKINDTGGHSLAPKQDETWLY